MNDEEVLALRELLGRIESGAIEAPWSHLTFDRLDQVAELVAEQIAEIERGIGTPPEDEEPRELTYEPIEEGDLP